MVESSQSASVDVSGQGGGEAPAGGEGAGGEATAPLPSIRDQLADALAQTGDDETPRRPAKASAGDDEGEAREGGEPPAKAPAKPAREASEGEGGSSDKDETNERGKRGRDEPGYRAYLNRKARRFEASQAQLGQRVAEVSHKSQEVAQRLERVAHLEGLDAELKRDPLAVLERLGLKPHEAVQALLERERSGAAAKPKAEPQADPERETLRKELEALKAREQERERVTFAREWVEGVSEKDHPHLAAYFEAEVTDPRARAEEIGACWQRFTQRHGREPRSDAELRGYMERLARANFEASRSKYERLKRIYEPGAERAPADARKGDGAPVAPGPKGRTAEGRTADRKPSLTNRASTDGGAPSRSYAERGDVAKALSAVITTADRD